jgi:hypothetical protein
MSQSAVSPPAQAPAGAWVLLRLFALPVLAFLGFGAFLALGIPTDRIKLVALAIATATLALIVVTLDRARPRERRNLLLSISSFSYLVFFVVPVFTTYVGDAGYDPDMSPNRIPLTPATVTRGVLAVFLGYAALIAGYALPIGRIASRVVPRMRREWSAETALVVAVVMIPVGWAVVLAGQFGVLPERAGSGGLGAVAHAASTGIGLIALCYQRYRSRVALVLLALVIPPTMLFNFFTASKILFLMPLVLVAVVHVIVTRRLRWWWIAGFLVVMSLFYPVSDVYRQYLFKNRLSAVQVIANPRYAFGLIARFTSHVDPKEYVQAGFETTARRLDSVGILSVIVRDAGTRVPFQNGASLVFIPASYVPRLLWRDKPKFTTGQWVTDHFGSGPQIRSSTGSSWMGELYFNFGWSGILVGMALLGIWFRFLQESFLGIDATIPSMLAGVSTILAVAPSVGGDMLGPTNGVVFSIAPVVFAHVIVRATTARPARLPPPL